MSAQLEEVKAAVDGVPCDDDADVPRVSGDTALPPQVLIPREHAEKITMAQTAHNMALQQAETAKLALEIALVDALDAVGLRKSEVVNVQPVIQADGQPGFIAVRKV